MKDKYDEAIEYLQLMPKEMIYAWNGPRGHSAGILFSFCSSDRRSKYKNANVIGCLTLIRQKDYYIAETPALTAAIQADERMPDHEDKITIDSLPVFAEWQRRIDKELNRV
jgi:hypothetical protein